MKRIVNFINSKGLDIVITLQSFLFGFILGVGILLLLGD